LDARIPTQPAFFQSLKASGEPTVGRLSLAARIQQKIWRKIRPKLPFPEIYSYPK
jgi:hypothetical protein